jgi:hypothetical protein
MIVLRILAGSVALGLLLLTFTPAVRLRMEGRHLERIRHGRWYLIKPLLAMVDNDEPRAERLSFIYQLWGTRGFYLMAAVGALFGHA